MEVRTPFGGVVTGLIIILTCVVLSPYLAYIPTSVLSAVIIFSMFSTIAYTLPYKLWKSQRKHIYPLAVYVSKNRIDKVLLGRIFLSYITVRSLIPKGPFVDCTDVHPLNRYFLGH